MTTNGRLLYRVDRVPAALQQIAKLMRRAAELGSAAEVAQMLRTVVHKLETKPSTWGDPQNNTHLPGGVVMRQWLHPLIVKYVLFEMDRVVVLLEVRAVPGHTLAQE
jgi:hypothetical protein